MKLKPLGAVWVTALGWLLFATVGARAQFAGTGDLKIDQPADKEDIASTPRCSSTARKLTSPTGRRRTASRR
ncbi:MAG: hypothetical protein NTY53_19510 [Kiritimatiellaeota bacterium]|nr:hypothetical protein [Kiritimatiellota bacterium]